MLHLWICSLMLHGIVRYGEKTLEALLLSSVFVSIYIHRRIGQHEESCETHTSQEPDPQFR